jgi:hemin uptake protein HemP
MAEHPEIDPPKPPPPAPERVTYTSADLFRGRREVYIEHDREMYCLRITSKNKLLLTK